MLRTTRFRVIMLAVVLGIAVASVAGITFSSNSAGGKSTVIAIRYSDVVRFAVQDETVEIMRAGERVAQGFRALGQIRIA